MELGRELYEKYKGRTAKGLFGTAGPVVGWAGNHLLIDVGSKSGGGWSAYEGYQSVGGTVHLPECGGTIFTYVNRVMEKNII